VLPSTPGRGHRSLRMPERRTIHGPPVRPAVIPVAIGPPRGRGQARRPASHAAWTATPATNGQAPVDGSSRENAPCRFGTRRNCAGYVRVRTPDNQFCVPSADPAARGAQTLELGHPPWARRTLAVVDGFVAGLHRSCLRSGVCSASTMSQGTGCRRTDDAGQARGPGRGSGAGRGGQLTGPASGPGTRRSHRARLGPQPARTAWPRYGAGASRPRARARSTASCRRCTPSLPYRLRMWVLTVLTDRYSWPAISGTDKLVGR
jgi:hypothetical protein